MNVEKFESLLADFKKICNPNETKCEPSYLEICDYPGSRTEEICSRLLAFFFDTRNPHGMGTLFWDTLIDVYVEKCNTPKKEEIRDLTFFKCHAETEVSTKKGRIDLLLTSDNCIVCIENKIWAYLDNDLDDYYEYTNGNRNHRTALYIIISMREDINEILSRRESLKNRGEYVVIFYREFLTKLKQNLGIYITSCSAKYFAILTDWIQFLDNQGDYMSKISREEENFFKNNDDVLRVLIEKRTAFLNKKKKYDAQRIISIKNLLMTKDENLSVEWWIYDNTDLGCHFEKGNEKFEIGLESGFDIKGTFNIQISIWQPKKNPKRLPNYQEVLSKIQGTETSCNEKWSKRIASLENSTDEKIAEELYKRYLTLKGIVDKTIENVKN